MITIVTRQELIAKLRALASVADTHLANAEALYYDPAAISDLFTRSSGLVEALRARFPSLFDDLPVRAAPVSSGTTDFDGRGYIHRHAIETVRRDLRYCVELVDGLPADAMNPAAVERPKDQKFAILDAPKLLERDLPESLGLLGAALIYIDTDRFKQLNSKFTERMVDRTILPQFQRLIADATAGHGYAYAEGGDEVVVLLPNFSPAMAVAFAGDLLQRIRSTLFIVGTSSENLTVSAGLATALGATDLEVCGRPCQ
jgi:hypothetical protein